MNRNLILSVFAVLFSMLLMISCSKDNTTTPDPTLGYLKLASGFAAGAATKVEIFAADSAFTGYNKFYIALTDSATGTYIENAQITLTPTMTMPMMSHSAPKENPSSTNAVDKLFPCSVSFIMASMSGTWTLAVNVQNLVNNKSGMVTFTINVKDPSPAKMFSFVSLTDNTTKFFVGFIPPTKPIVGINDFEFVVYKKQSMMMFPADSSLNVSFIPTMPTMGHSSPNNINPVYIGNGHYKGKVNFTMTGLWRMSMTFNAGTTLSDSTHYFDFNF